MKQIPNLFTLLNLFFGCIAIIFILQNGISILYNAEGRQYIDMPERIWVASLFIGLAALVDFLDGFLARLLRVSSAFGKQIDSLADLVSFGVAPGMILYQFLRISLMRQEDSLNISIWWLLPALLVPCAAAYRLARFNLDDTQRYGFKGVPTPAVGLLIASFPLIYWSSYNENLQDIFLNKWVWYVIIILVSYLMVSSISIMALKFRDYTLRNNIPKIMLIVGAVFAGILIRWLAVPTLFLFYIGLSLVSKNKTT